MTIWHFALLKHHMPNAHKMPQTFGLLPYSHSDVTNILYSLQCALLTIIYAKSTSKPTRNMGQSPN